MSGWELKVAGVTVLARPSGGLWLAAERALVVADLHFEKGSAYAARGQLLPPYDTAETLRRLEAEAMALDPRVIVFLGDTLHDGEAEDRIANADAARVAALARSRTLVWITGNHDAGGPRGLPGVIRETLPLAGLTLVHEPSPRPARGEIAGHLHPCARVAGAGGRRRCFATDGERMILPAFGAYAGGLAVTDPVFGGLLGPKRIAGVISRSRVHAIPWGKLTGG